jgi:hypothetical protein
MRVSENSLAPADAAYWLVVYSTGPNNAALAAAPVDWETGEAVLRGSPFAEYPAEIAEFAEHVDQRAAVLAIYTEADYRAALEGA